MKPVIRKTTFAVLLLSCMIQTMTAQEKLAQTGFQFLSVVSDARGASLANTMTTMSAKSSALFFNPATMAGTDYTVDASFSLNEWIADINHNNISFALNPSQGKYGAYGISLQFVDYGEILGTIVADTDLGYEDTGMLSATAMAAGLGYSKRITDRFSVGGQAKYIAQDLGSSFIPLTDSTTTETGNDASVLAVDFGTYYQTGYKSLAFGISVRNFSQEISFVRESFQLPLTFNLGVSIDLTDFAGFVGEDHAMVLAVQASNARSYAEQASFALEYGFSDFVFLRGGYVSENDEDDFTFGFGVSTVGLTIDYAYTPFGVFDNIQRFSVRFAY